MNHDKVEPVSVLPLLRWAGSKKRQFKMLQPYFPQRFENYVEPFAGSASFFFCLSPKAARLNDVNKNVIDFYRHCKSDPDEFYAEFSSIPRSRRRYYSLRTEFNAAPRSRRKSLLFYYLNRNCFNGIHRTNKDGDFNVPFSDNRVSPYLGKKRFVASVKQLSSAKITNLDFEEFCIENTNSDDFVYLDPPYFKIGQRIFNEYNAFPFEEADFIRLERTLKLLDKRGAMFLLSFVQTEQTLQLANKWRSQSQLVTRTVAGDPSKRRKQRELLICNYDAQKT